MNAIYSFTPASVWKEFKTQAGHVSHTLSQIKKSLIEKITAVYNFIYPKNPITGHREFWYLPTAVEILAGKALYSARISASGGKLDDEKVQTRIQGIADKMEGYAQRPGKKFEYEVVVVRDSSINAWALPGGKIACNKGLIDAVDKMDLSKYDGVTADDVLAAVLGHELAHAAIGHSRKQLEKTLLIQLSIFAAKIATLAFVRGKEDEELDQAENKTPSEQYRHVRHVSSKYQWARVFVQGLYDYGVQFSADLFKLALSRHAEYEADKWGIQFANKGRFKMEGALALQDLFKKIGGCSHQSETFVGHVLEKLSTHPTPTQRLEKNKKTIEAIRQKKASAKT